MEALLKGGGLAVAIISLIVAILKWQLSRAKKKNRALTIDNQKLAKVIRIQNDVAKEKSKRDKERDRIFPHGRSDVDLSDPYIELREHEKNR